MKKTALILSSVLLLSGCATFKQITSLFPKKHDPAMFQSLVTIEVLLENVDCNKNPQGWEPLIVPTKVLARSAELRNDPQAENLKGLEKHIHKMNQGASKTFCELGKKTAKTRIEVAEKAWESR